MFGTLTPLTPDGDGLPLIGPVGPSLFSSFLHAFLDLEVLFECHYFRNDPELSVNGYLGIADNSAATTSRAPLLHPVPLSPAPENGQIQSGSADLDESLASVPGPSTATSPTTSRVAGQHPDPNFYINKMMSGVADLKGKIWGLEPDRLAEATEFVLENFRTHLFPG